LTIGSISHSRNVTYTRPQEILERNGFPATEAQEIVDVIIYNERHGTRPPELNYGKFRKLNERELEGHHLVAVSYPFGQIASGKLFVHAWIGSARRHEKVTTLVDWDEFETLRSYYELSIEHERQQQYEEQLEHYMQEQLRNLQRIMGERARSGNYCFREI